MLRPWVAPRLRAAVGDPPPRGRPVWSSCSTARPHAGCQFAGDAGASAGDPGVFFSCAALPGDPRHRDRRRRGPQR
eukprot:10580307-Lingulodinium_polyedra.AAC.1